MNAHETEIRRHAGGAIDIDYYVRRCRHRRSLAAHEAIGRFLAGLGALIEGTLERRRTAPAAEEREAASRQPRLRCGTAFTATGPAMSHPAAVGTRRTRRKARCMGLFHRFGRLRPPTAASGASR